MTLKFETNRLLLRPFIATDAPFLYELNNDEEVMRYTGDNSFESIAAAREFAINYTTATDSQYLKYKMGRLAVIRKEDNAFLGWNGLKYDVYNDVVDIGYRLMKKYWGNGYATESSRRVIEHGFEGHQLASIIANVHELNIGSQFVAERIGMKIDYRYLWDNRYPARLYKITVNEYRNSQDF